MTDTVDYLSGPFSFSRSLVPRRILVTGGAGFIGSHLCDALLARGDEVVVLDDLSTGDRGNLANATEQPGFRFVRGSVLDPVCVDDLVCQVDQVVHLAAAVGVRLIMEQPLRSFLTNLHGTENVLASAHRFRRPTLIMSTSEIYGKNGSDALNEDSDCLHGPPSVVRWAYSTAKAVDEILANLYHRERGLDVTVVRLFNTVGPRQSHAYGMVLPTLVRQAVRGEPLTVFGSGEQTRCFLHVADAVRGLMLLLDSDQAFGGTFNIGNTEEISINALASRILAVTGSDSSTSRIPYGDAFGAGFEDMARRVPDTARIGALVGWAPQFSLADIVAELVSQALVAA